MKYLKLYEGYSIEYYNSLALNYILNKVREVTVEKTIYDIKEFLDEKEIDYIDGHGKQMLEKLPLLINYRDEFVHYVVVTNIFEGVIRIYNPVIDKTEDIWIYDFEKDWIDEYGLYIIKPETKFIDCDPGSYR
jgi:hypothetical protein